MFVKRLSQQARIIDDLLNKKARFFSRQMLLLSCSCHGGLNYQKLEVPNQEHGGLNGEKVREGNEKP